MSITLTGTNGLFTRFGKEGKALNNFLSYLSSTLGTDIDAIYAAYPGDGSLVDSLYALRDQVRLNSSTLANGLQARMSKTLVKMADDDAALIQENDEYALQELIQQMEAASASVNASTASVSVSAASGNTGNAVVRASVIGPDGKTLQYLFDEDAELRVTTDAQDGLLTEGQESLTLRGEAAQPDTLAWNWPQGSGAQQTGTMIDATQDNSGNLLTNSDFEDFTSHIPDNWVRDIGTAGTTVLAGGSSDAYMGSNCLRIVGDGSQLTTLSQTFDDSTDGTAGTLLPSTVYAVNVFTKVSAVPSGGVLRFALVDGSDAVINDDEGTANSFSVTLTGSTTSYASGGGFFRTPSVMPDEYKLQIKLTTALENGKSVFIDHLALGEPIRAYTGGFYVAAFSASTAAIRNDRWTLAVTSTLGGFQKLFERAFKMRDKGLTLPFSGSPTINDNLLS